jgi:cell wall-associated NlpC family hydrolase
MQEQALGTPVDPNAEFSNLRRGDLVFWKGHIAIVRDPQTLLHANAFHMAVALEPIAEAIPRIRVSDGPPTTVKRR